MHILLARYPASAQPWKGARQLSLRCCKMHLHKQRHFRARHRRPSRNKMALRGTRKNTLPATRAGERAAKGRRHGQRPWQEAVLAQEHRLCVAELAASPAAPGRRRGLAAAVRELRSRHQGACHASPCCGRRSAAMLAMWWRLPPVRMLTVPVEAEGEPPRCGLQVKLAGLVIDRWALLGDAVGSSRILFGRARLVRHSRATGAGWNGGQHGTRSSGSNDRPGPGG